MANYLIHDSPSWDRPGGVGDTFDPSPGYMAFMKSEKNRLDSFKNWLPSMPQRPIELAKSGLFYTKICDRVQCPFCSGVLKNWLPSDDPYIEHSRHFPYCCFIRGLDVGNIPIESTIPTISKPLYIICNENYHQSQRAVNIIPPNATNIVTYTERELSTSYPVSGLSNAHKDYTFEKNRLETFSRWPPNLNQDPCELARAGFYLIPKEGKLDRVQCAYCKGKLFDWAPHDDPWQEHKRCFPHCPYIKLCMRDDTSKQNQSASSFCSVHDDERPSTSPPPPEPPPGNMATSASTEYADNLKHKMKSEAVEAILEMGYSKDLVLRVVKKCLKERPGNFPPTEELASMVIELDDPQPAAFPAASPLTPLQRMMAAAASTKSQTSSGNKPDTGSSQNSSRDKGDHFKHKTNERLLCKICMENQVRVTFMPCGHLACCGPCSLDLMECPICRSHIIERVRTYF